MDLRARAKELASRFEQPSEGGLDLRERAKRIVERTDPTFADYAENLPKALGRGVVRGAGMAATGIGKGISIVGPDALGDPIAEAGMALGEMGPAVDPRVANSLAGMTAEGIGTSVLPLAAAAGTAGLGGGALAISSAAGATGVAMEGGGGYQEAIARGGTEDQARKAAMLSAPLGLLDLLGPEVGQGTRIGRSLAKGAAVMERAGITGRIASSMVREATTETLQGKGSDIAQRIAGTIKDEEEARSLLDIAKQEGLPAALGSAIVEAVTSWATGGRRVAKVAGVEKGQKQSVAADAPQSSGNPPATPLSGGEVVEDPEPAIRAAVDRLMSQPEVRGRGNLPMPHTILTAPDEIADRAASIGARVVMVKPDRSMPVEGFYDRTNRTIILNADAGPIETQRALFRHELTHFAADTAPDVYQDLAAAIDAVSPGLIDRQAQTREGRQRVISGTEVKGPVLNPDLAREEGVAETIQAIPTFEELVRLNPDVAFKVATYQPTIIRRVADVLIDLAHAIGIAKSGSVGKLIREIEATLATPVEKLMGVKRGTQLALKVAELEKSLRVATPMPQPMGGRAKTPIAPRLDLPVVEPVEGFPTPEVGKVKPTGPGFQDVPTARRKAQEARTRFEAVAGEEAAKLAEKTRAVALERVTDLEARAAKATGRAKSRLEREAIDLRAALDEADRARAKSDPKAVGDVVRLPDGGFARVTSVKGDTVKVLTIGPRRLGDPETTLGVPELRSRTYLASDVELQARPSAEPVGPKPPTKAQEREAAKGSKAKAVKPEPVAPSKPSLPVKPVERKPRAIPKPKPIVYFDERMARDEVRTQLRSMVKNEAGWEQVGGQLVYEQEGDLKREVAGRTKWIPKSQWWGSRPEDARLNERELREAVGKAIAGKSLGVRQKRAIEHMLDAIDEMEAQWGPLSPGTLDILGNGFVGEYMTAEEMDRIEREAIQNEDLAPSDDLGGQVPFALKRVPAMTKRTLRDVIASYGADNDDQTARTSLDEYTRNFQAGVRYVRSQDLAPSPRSDAYDKADSEIARAPVALRDRLLEKYRNRAILEPWEQVALSKLADRAFTQATRGGGVDAIKEATRLRWVYEDVRRLTAQALGVIRDGTKEWDTASEAFASLITKGSKRTRNALEKIRKQLDDVSLSSDARFALQQEMDKLVDKEAKRTEKALQALRDAGLDPDLVTMDYFRDLGTFSVAARIASTSKADARDKFLEWRYAMMLSGPITHVRNLTGNTAHYAYRQGLLKLTEAIVNTARQNPDAAQWGELPHVVRAFLPGLAQAGKNFLATMRTELPAFQYSLGERGVNLPGMVSQTDAMDVGNQAIGGMLGRVVRFPSTTLLLATDEFFKTLSYHTEAVSLAYRMSRGNVDLMEQILADADSPIQLQAWEESKRVTFQDAESSKILQGILALRRGVDDTMRFPVGSTLFPFVKTPYRIFQRGLEIPFSPAIATVNMLRGKWKTTPGLAEKDMASALLGLGITLALAYAMDGDDGEERITGSRSLDPRKAELDERVAPPQSFRVGGQWFSYASIEPFSVATTTAIDSIRGGDIASATASIMSQASDKTMLRTLGDIQRLVSDVAYGQDRGSSTERMATSILWTPMFPNAVRGPVRAADDVRRIPRLRPTDEKSTTERAIEDLPYQALPISRFATPEDYDLWGQPMSKPGGNYLERLLSPVDRRDRSNPFVADIVLKRWNEQVDDGKLPGESKYLPTRPGYTYTRDGVKRYWSDADLSRLRREAGEIARESLEGIPFDTDNPTASDIATIKKSVERARRVAADRILSEREAVAP